MPYQRLSPVTVLRDYRRPQTRGYRRIFPVTVGAAPPVTPVVRGVTIANTGAAGSGNNMAPGYPPNTAQGDVMYLVGNVIAGAAASLVITGGMTGLTSLAAMANNNSSGQFWVWKKVLTLADLSAPPVVQSQVSGVASSRQMCASMLTMEPGPHDTIGAINEQVAIASGSILAVTPAADNELMIGVICGSGTTANTAYGYTAPAGWTTPAQALNITTAAGTRGSIFLCYQQLGGGTHGNPQGPETFAVTGATTAHTQSAALLAA